MAVRARVRGPLDRSRGRSNREGRSVGARPSLARHARRFPRAGLRGLCAACGRAGVRTCLPAISPTIHRRRVSDHRARPGGGACRLGRLHGDRRPRGIRAHESPRRRPPRRGVVFEDRRGIGPGRSVVGQAADAKEILRGVPGLSRSPHVRQSRRRPGEGGRPHAMDGAGLRHWANGKAGRPLRRQHLAPPGRRARARVRGGVRTDARQDQGAVLPVQIGRRRGVLLRFSDRSARGEGLADAAGRLGHGVDARGWKAGSTTARAAMGRSYFRRQRGHEDRRAVRPGDLSRDGVQRARGRRRTRLERGRFGLLGSRRPLHDRGVGHRPRRWEDVSEAQEADAGEFAAHYLRRGIDHGQEYSGLVQARLRGAGGRA